MASRSYREGRERSRRLRFLPTARREVAASPVPEWPIRSLAGVGYPRLLAAPSLMIDYFLAPNLEIEAIGRQNLGFSQEIGHRLRHARIVFVCRLRGLSL